MKTTLAKFNAIIRELREVGFSGLDEDQKAILEASDAGTLEIISR